jgi:MFS family permease
MRTRPAWLNRNVAGMTLTSFLADIGYEMVTAVLPGFMNALGVAAAALGWIEGVADAASNFVKLGGGWYSDRIGRRKGLVAAGYFLSGTALALCALAVSWPLILLARLIAWFGKGIRGPLRDALLSESVAPDMRGRAFGFHRAGDTVGAVLGPLLGVWLLSTLPAPDAAAPYRSVFVASIAPGLLAVATFLAIVREGPRMRSRHTGIWTAIRELPPGYLRFLVGVGVFGLGDFSHALLVLAAAQLLEPAMGAVQAGQMAALLYAWRNFVYAAASFPIGALADRVDRPTLLAAGYMAGALTAAMAAALFLAGVTNVWWLAALFALAGAYIAAEDALEGAIPADYAAPAARGTAYGLMGTVNGAGDLVASVLVGTLWTVVSPAFAFSAAAVLMFAGAVLMGRSETGRRVG